MFAQFTKLDWKVHNVGKVRQVVTNMGTLNKALTRFPGLINSEFPPGSDEEHLYQGGLWVGAITPTGDTLVSTTQAHFTPNEFFPTAAPWDTIWVASKGDTLQIPYWPNYAGMSDQDFICRYSDYNVLNIDNHVPLYLDVIQTSYAWGSPPVDEFIIYKYYIVPKKFPLKNVYVGFWMHSSVGSINAGDNFIDELTHYFPEYRMAVAEDDRYGNDGLAISPIGFRVLNPTDGGLSWAFKYYEHEDLPNRDPAVYKGMASGTIMPDRLDPARAHIVLAFGPFQANVNDTIKVEMAEVFGYGMKGLLKNAEYLNFLKTKGFKVPSPPPKPVFRVTTGSHEVRIDWHPLDNKTNPELYEDPSRGDTIRKPFEGYRLYKSTKGLDGPWSLLAEYDRIDDIGFNTGLQYDYRDVGLLNNVEYYYTLTTYSKPDHTINFPSQETSLRVNARTVVPGVPPPQTVGEVAVVPNPYRGDIAYSSYNPSWEKPQGSRPWWMEQDRRIQFINLPERCEIRIYTLAGDLVNTIRHENSIKGFEDWNLTSSVGQAIASGIYLFTVEDLNNGTAQVGKFVVIK
ncbi:MAG: hypothetical protein HY088_05600 [Ignavibacteriales bacterium]|nr:hypothetical protein [Ignavibacteriales bacterium]